LPVCLDKDVAMAAPAMFKCQCHAAAYGDVSMRTVHVPLHCAKVSVSKYKRLEEAKRNRRAVESILCVKGRVQP